MLTTYQESHNLSFFMHVSLTPLTCYPKPLEIKLILQRDNNNLYREVLNSGDKGNAKKRSLWSWREIFTSACKAVEKSLSTCVLTDFVNFTGTFSEETGPEPAHSSHKMKLSFAEIRSKHFENFKRMHKIVWKNLGNGRIYIAINCRYFSSLSVPGLKLWGAATFYFLVFILERIPFFFKHRFDITNN